MPLSAITHEKSPAFQRFVFAVQLREAAAVREGIEAVRPVLAALVIEAKTLLAGRRRWEALSLLLLRLAWRRTFSENYLDALGAVHDMIGILNQRADLPWRCVTVVQRTLEEMDTDCPYAHRYHGRIANVAVRKIPK